MKAQPHDVDIHVGNAIKIQRVMKRLSQSALGERVGVASQQIQKYERGANRVSASMLVEIANALEVDVRIFFDELASQASSAASTANDNQAVSDAFKASREGMLLNAAFSSITDRLLRKRILQLVQSIAESEQGGGDHGGRLSAQH